MTETNHLRVCFFQTEKQFFYLTGASGPSSPLLIPDMVDLRISKFAGKRRVVSVQFLASPPLDRVKVPDCPAIRMLQAEK